MPISYDEAISELSSREFSVNERLELLKSVSGEVITSSDNNIYLLNSGPSLDGSSSSNIAGRVSNISGVVAVADSHAGKLMFSDELARALNEAVKIEIFDDPSFMPNLNLMGR